MKEELIETYKEYIKLLEKALGDNAVYLYTHGIVAKQEDIDKGKELRAKIESLSIN